MRSSNLTNPNANAAVADSACGEEDFTRAELERAVDWRQRITYAPGARRTDRCPHAEVCPDLKTCVRAIAWYIRHQHEIEGLDA